MENIGVRGKLFGPVHHEPHELLEGELDRGERLSGVEMAPYPAHVLVRPCQQRWMRQKES